MSTSFRLCFPSRFLEATDLRDYAGMGIPVIVTLERLWHGQAVRKETGEVEIEWFVKWAEFNRPMRLKSYPAGAIARLYGDDMDQWVGRQCAIYAIETLIWGKMKWVINIGDQVPVQRPSLPANSDLSSLAAGKRASAAPVSCGPVLQPPNIPALDARPMGEELAGKVMDGLRGVRANWDDFLRHLKQTAPYVFDIAWGKALCDVPVAVLDYAREFVRSRLAAGAAESAPPAIPTVSPQVVTGPVVDRTPIAPAPASAATVPPDDDIPF